MIVLEARDLTIGYKGRNGRIIAHDLDLTLQAGKLVCLLGPNGAGKTTLLRALTGTSKPLAGSVRVLDRDLFSLSPREIAQRVSIVLTERVDAPLLTAREFVALGRYPYTGWMGQLSAADEHVVGDALAQSGAMLFAERYVAELSDGERQRVTVARALAQGTPLLVLDEPTAFLDLPRRVELMRLLATLAHEEANRAILLSTHDLELALRYADRLWLMSEAGTLTVCTAAEAREGGLLVNVFGEAIKEIL